MPLRPRSGPFGPHLSLGGLPQARWRRSQRTEELPLRVGVIVSVACLLQCGGGALRACSRPGRASVGLVCPCYCIQSATADGGGGCSLPYATVLSSLQESLLLGLCWPRNMDHGATAVVIARPWWRVLVGGALGGALRIVRGRGSLEIGRNPCHFGNDAVTLEGVAVPS